MPKYNDFPIEECAAAVKPYIERGATVHQKFTCAKCGSRQTVEAANKFFTTGKCEECGHITDIRTGGCNYTLMGPVDVMLDFMKGGVNQNERD